MSEENKKEMSDDEVAKLANDLLNADNQNDLLKALGLGGGGGVQTMSMQDMMEQKSKDQEIITFDFLKQIMVLGGADESLSNKTLEQYNDENEIKVHFSLMALNFLSHDKREELMNAGIWTAPYGYFYMWQFAVNGIPFLNDAGLEHVTNLLTPLPNDFDTGLDYGRFNHFGRILGVAKQLVFSANSNNELDQGIQDILMKKLMGNVWKHKEEVLIPASKGEGNYDSLRDVEVEACEMSIRVIDTLWAPLLTSSLLYNVNPNEDSKKVLEEGIQKTLDFVNDLKGEDWMNERAKLFADIDKELVNMRTHIQQPEDSSMDDLLSSLKAMMAQMKEESPEDYAEMEKQAKALREPNKESE